MLTYYWKMIWRFLQNQRVYSLINIGGLAVGLASCIFIMIFIQDEFNYDRFHNKLDRVYQLVAERESGATSRVVATSSYPTSGALQTEFPAVEAATHIVISSVDVQSDADMFSGRMLVADSAFWKIFDFPLIESFGTEFPSGVNRVWLSEQTAQTYFGDQNPIG